MPSSMVPHPLHIRKMHEALKSIRVPNSNTSTSSAGSSNSTNPTEHNVHGSMDNVDKHAVNGDFSDLLGQLGSVRFDQTPIDENLLPSVDDTESSICIQVVDGQLDPDVPHYVPYLEARINPLRETAVNFGKDHISLAVRVYEAQPGRIVAMARVFCSSHMAQEFVLQHTQAHPHGETNQITGETVFVALWDDRVLVVPALPYELSSYEAQLNGDYLNACQIRWHGRERVESAVVAHHAFDMPHMRRLHNTNYRFGPFNNAVSEMNVMAGTDVRTTIMLRNIPNNMSTTQLMATLNNVCYGRYNFLYLRYDFFHRKNVGYAFVNLVSPAYILDILAWARNGTWANSNRNPEATYATIQGTEALIEKFRNSNVMLQSWEMRPHLLYTIEDGAKCPGEKEFPGPDNITRMRRSQQNAQDIGLFPPSYHGHAQYLDNFGRGQVRHLLSQRHPGHQQYLDTSGRQVRFPLSPRHHGHQQHLDNYGHQGLYDRGSSLAANQRRYHPVAGTECFCRPIPRHHL